MKNSKIPFLLIAILIICNFGSNAQSQMMSNSSFAEGYINKLQIIIRQPEEPLVAFAAEELQRYVRQLFGFQPSLFHGETGSGDAATSILLKIEAGKSLSNQGYMIRRTQHKGKPAILVTGGSPRATLWAVYEVISNWGVHFLVQGDVFPEKAGSFHLPDLDLKREPVFPCREFRVINDMANTTVFWSLNQHKKLFDQLVKLRFTGIYIQTWAHQPWVHYTFRGIERDQNGLCFGWKHPIHEGMIGRQLFGNFDYYTNPDFQGAETYEERLLCGQRFMHGLIAAAHERGLEVTFVQPLDLPEKFITKLPELSKAAGVVLPDESISQEKFARYGLERIGGSPEATRYCSPLNPVYVDLVETALVANIKAYPNAESYGLNEAEFPPGAAGVKACWDALNAKYNLEEKFSLEDILAKAQKQFFYANGRALAQAQGAIQTLRLLDILVNERNVLQYASNPRAKIRGSFFSEHIQPLVEYVLPPEKFEFMAVIDYLPSKVAERMHTLEFVKKGKTDAMLITTIEDDNVGFLPQLVTPSLHKTVQKMREYGLKGFIIRQFDITQHEPAMAYMIEAAWDIAVTPEDSYLRYALGVAGEKSVGDLIAAFHDLEDLTKVSNAMMGVGFMWPHLYKKYWKPGTKPDPAWQEYMARLVPIEDRLRTALSMSEPKGRRLVENYLNFIVFARQYVHALDLIRTARLAYDVAQEKRKTEDDFVYNPLIRRTSDLLFEALAASETALTTWTKLVADPTDLGTLAGLNAYGHDWLQGKCTEVYWESQQYGKMVE